MKHCVTVLTMTSLLLFMGIRLNAGNEDRSGSAGSTDLLINPWARSSGFAGANTAIGKGLEAQFLNVAGLAFTKKTEILFAHTRWLAGSDISINAFGFAQNLGKNRGIVALSVMTLNSGDIVETTYNQPEGTGSIYSVSNLNIALSYAKSFSDKISGGITIHVINQSISNIRATGIALDAGIQYRATVGKGKLNKGNLVFGITLKNIGPRMSARGDGLSVSNTSPIHGANVTQKQRSAKYELPALMNIGIAYVERFTEAHTLNVAFNFTTNSFTKDQFKLGLEYKFKEWFGIRGGYTFETGIFGQRDGINADLLNAFTGPAFGVSLLAPFKKGGSTKIGFDYSYRATFNFSGVHTFGARLYL